MKNKKLLYIPSLLLFIAIFLTGCERVPEPMVKEGRFDFSVTYEVNGQIDIVQGVFVCEFVCARVQLGGYSREWNGYIEGNNFDEMIKILDTEDGEIFLYLNLSAKYFMSDPFLNPSWENTPKLVIEYNDIKAEELGVYRSFDEAILSSYGVKIIDYLYDEPIKNVYR